MRYVSLSFFFCKNFVFFFSMPLLDYPGLLSLV